MNRHRLGLTARILVSLSIGLLASGCTMQGAPDESVAEVGSAVVEESTWSFTIQSAPHHPQDVWIAAHGSNTDGWQSGGSVCLGLLANDEGPTDPTPAFQPGDHATLLTTVVEAGVFGVDGTPVPAGDYLAPGLEIDQSPARAFSLAAGENFYVIFDGEVINTSEPAAFPFPVGSTTRYLFTFDFPGEGRQIVEGVLWIGIPDGGSYFYFPFLNEGTMMLNARSK